MDEAAKAEFQLSELARINDCPVQMTAELASADSINNPLPKPVISKCAYVRSIWPFPSTTLPKHGIFTALSWAAPRGVHPTIGLISTFSGISLSRIWIHLRAVYRRIIPSMGMTFPSRISEWF